MELTRRGAVTLAVAGAGALAAASVPVAVATTARPADLVRSSFSGLVGQQFSLSSDDGTTETATLQSVDDLPSGAPGSELQFSLLFGASSVIGSATYLLRQAAIGAMPLFLSPVGIATAGAAQLQAVVDRSR